MNESRLHFNPRDISRHVNLTNEYAPNLKRRHRIAQGWLVIFQISTLIGIFALSALLFNIINDSAGYVALTSKKDPIQVTGGKSLAELSNAELVNILQNNLTANRLRTLQNQVPLTNRSSQELIKLVEMEVIKPEIQATWTLSKSVINRAEIAKTALEDYPGAFLQFKSWLTRDFVSGSQSSNPLSAGIRTAILGALWVIIITILVAFPIGVGAAIYLEEYSSREKWGNRLIQTNITNLAAVPSIIYGILGLTIFVRALEPLTSGSIFGISDSTAVNGRTILSGGLTLALLVLPIIIINAQEAIRAVPSSIRQASYGLGATRWQTIWSHVLPNSFSGILTGTILALSRALGETAPLIVVGVSTYITTDPSNIFSKFTTLPVQIYQWTSRPQDEWRNLAAASIIILMVLLLLLNASAIVLRNKFSRKYS